MEDLVMFDVIKNTYKGKKVFLTGHTGFKGSWMTLTLNMLGAEIKGFALEPEGQNDLYNIINGNLLCHSVIADIRDLTRLKSEIESFQPDYVFHFAAQALVRRSYDEPVETFDVNVMGTVNLLEAVKGVTGPCNVVVVTTDKVYENMESEELYQEDDKLGGYDPYSSSKAASEIVAGSYRLAFFNPDDYGSHKKGVATARSGNVIGGGDWSKDRIIPDLVRAFQDDKMLTVRNPNAVRPWQHVLEPLSGYLLLGARLNEDPAEFASGYNFGPKPEDELTVEELVKIAIEQWGSGNYETPKLNGQPHETGLLMLAINKAKDILGWEPVLNSQQAIANTIYWYKNCQPDPLDVTKAQISEYFQL